MTLTDGPGQGNRELLGWTPSQLAGRVGLSATTIVQFERGARRWPFSTFPSFRAPLKKLASNLLTCRPASGLKIRMAIDFDHDLGEVVRLGQKSFMAEIRPAGANSIGDQRRQNRLQPKKQGPPQSQRNQP
jgi:transcriptional regulator with XRE-family HTH domain